MRGLKRLLPALACLLLAACAEPPPEPEPVVRPIKMLAVGGGAGGTREYPGRIRAGQQVDMAFEVDGRIVEFVYKEGQLVEEGSILTRLDPRDYQNQLRKARALLEQARTYRDRIAKAHETRAVSEQDLTNAEADVEVARAEVRIRRKALDDTELRAPFDGIMSRKLVEDFANVQAKEPVLVFEDTSILEIKVSVPERDLAGRRRTDDTNAQFTERTRPEVVVSSLPDHRFPGRLEELATHADPTTRTFQATFRFEKPEELNVLPGMTAKVVVHLPTDDQDGGFLIPALAAVAGDDGSASVWVVDPQSMAVKRRPVVLGGLQDDGVLVTSGLSSGELIAISGVALLREGMVVSRWQR